MGSTCLRKRHSQIWSAEAWSSYTTDFAPERIRRSQRAKAASARIGGVSDPWTDPDHLLREQYRDGARLLARQSLHREFSTARIGWQEWLFQQMRLPPATAVLEVGCGRGELWWENRDSIPQGLALRLTDLSPGMVAEARERLAPILPGARFEVADAHDLEYADGQFDVVLAHHMLYHLRERGRALAEFWRVLRPGGLILAATNGQAHLEQLRQFERLSPARAASGSPGSEFNLENGRVQLAPWFAQVRVTRRRDWLRVTRPEPVVEYLRSLTIGRLSEPELGHARQLVTDAIRRDGHFGVQTEAGLFWGRRRLRPPAQIRGGANQAGTQSPSAP
jgi:SAM-dependent methyltransferase